MKQDARFFLKTVSTETWLLVAAILVYGGLGSPTPDRAGAVEVVIAIFLLAAAKPWRVIGRFYKPGPAWERAACYLLIAGLTLPVCVGLVFDNGLAPMLRDIVPFLFLLLPLFFSPLLATCHHAERLLVTAAIVSAGLMFAARVIYPSFISQDILVLKRLLPSDPFYLANAPTVLCAALVCIGHAGKILYDRSTVRTFLLSGVLAFGALVAVVAMMMVEQRASAGVIVCACILWMTLFTIRNPVRTLLPLALAGIALTLVWPDVIQIGTRLLAKTDTVGVNMRGQEAQAVLGAVGGSFMTVVFGKGWGAVFDSPAVGGLSVNFTHSLITTYLLKTGLCGLALVCLYLWRLGGLLVEMFRSFPIMAIAIAGPFLIDIFLYASFKSLDFGLLLLLIPLWATARAELHSAAGYSMQKMSPV